MSQQEPPAEHEQQPTARRKFLSLTSGAAMGGGLVAAYGTLAFMAGKFLYAEGEHAAWQFVATIDAIPPGTAYSYISPTGYPIVIARHGEGETAEDFIALSSVCPHLGCQVHWELNNDRFFCPCHNGVFDPQGKAISGPPEKGNQNLSRYELEVHEGQLFVLVPLPESAAGSHVAQGEETRGATLLAAAAPSPDRKDSHG